MDDGTKPGGTIVSTPARPRGGHLHPDAAASADAVASVVARHTVGRWDPGPPANIAIPPIWSGPTR